MIRTNKTERTNKPIKKESGGLAVAKNFSDKPLDKDTVRWVALGGLEEIGRNMMFFEYRDEILIIDGGLQFPEEETPGIDYIIPNVNYLAAKKKNIKGMIITHAHYDHIGALPYIMDKIGNPIIFTTRLSKEIILRRQEDFPKMPKPIFQLIKENETHRISDNFSVDFFSVVHNIPEGVGMIINTPIGKIVHPGEFKFDYDAEGKPRGLDIWEGVGKQGIHTLMLDSTGAEVPGYALSERIVEQELEKLFKQAEGRIIVGTFASLIDRLGEIVKIDKSTIIPIEDAHKYKDDKILVLSTGAQGESRASLMRIANGEHKQIRIKPTDMAALSSP